ncbi:MAG: sigma-70 family RNA polymerase sigma factor [Chthoniobacterales bacterium]|nr:sigma-70 family RNA polymerase sigma factor [Chthoniobacterales bacterium]
MAIAVQPPPGTIYGQADPFASTQWSVISAAGKMESNPESSREALAQLCQTYWPPLYTYARARGRSPHDAQDLTQSFFAHLIEHQIYRRTDRQKGKFRSFLLASFKNFLADARDREQTLKRGGDFVFVPLDERQTEVAEALFHMHHSSSSDVSGEDRLFERTWAETLVATALDRLTAAYRAEGKQNLLDELGAFLSIGAAPPPTYGELASRLGVAEVTLRSHVARLRVRYRAMLREEVRRTVRTDDEVDGELRELLRVLTRG